jgi:hypothetical protein
MCLGAIAEGAPKIQFEKTVYDFGKTSVVESVTGKFIFKNVGDAVLKVEQPQPTCGCTVATISPNSLNPGESGELPFTLNLGRYTAKLEKRITVRSNDPQTPETILTVKAEYTPLYEVTPTSLAPNLRLGGKDTNLIVTVRRTDGKPVRLANVVASKPWITSQIEPSSNTNDSIAKIRLHVAPDGPPRRFAEHIQIYTDDKTNMPASTVWVQGQLRGDLTLSPEVLYWNITDPEKAKAEHPDAMVTRRVTIRSTSGKDFEVKNPQSTIKGLQFEVVPKEPGKVYELVAKVNEVPERSISGNVSFETSLPTEPKLVLPFTIGVFKPNK